MPIFNYYPTATGEEIPDHYNNSFYRNYANNSSILASRQQPISYLHSHPLFSHNIWSSDSHSTLPTQVGSSSSSQSVPSLSSRSWSLYNHHSDSEDENEIDTLSSSSLSDYSNALMIQKQQRQQQTSQLQRAQQPVEQQEKQSVKSYQQQLQLKQQPQQQQQQEVSQSNNRQKEQESDEDDEEHNSKFRHLFHHHHRSPSRFFHRHQNHNTNNSNNNNSSYDKNSTKMRRVPIDEPIEQQIVNSGQQFSISPKISPSQQQPPITTNNFEKRVENEKQQKTKSEEQQQQQLQNDDSHGILTIDQFLSFTNKKIIHSKADGSCLFRSVSQALVQSQNKHKQVRELAVDWMRTHLDTLIDGAVPFRDSIFLKENQSNVQDYLRDMEVEGEWGDFSCIVALSHCLGVRFKIVVVQGETVTSVLDVSPQNEKQEKRQEEEKDEDERQVIWLMFDEPRQHYNLIVNNQ